MAISAKLAAGLGWSLRRFSGHFRRGLHSTINNMSGKAWADQVYGLFSEKQDFLVKVENFVKVLDKLVLDRYIIDNAIK